MSEHADTHSHADGHGLIQEPEDIDMGRSMAILVGSLLAFAAVVVWAAIILHLNFIEVLPGGWPKAPPEIGRAEIGIVNQKMFVVDRRVERRAAQAQDELNSYGWVNQKQGQVHIPIEQAMKALLAEQPE
jgi:hypothetical protein